jgi:hypothetical protein
MTCFEAILVYVLVLQPPCRRGRPFAGLWLPKPVRHYAPGSPEKQSLKAKLREILSRQIDIPLTVNARDEERILRSIRSAAKQADFVILHSHDIVGSGELSPAPAHLRDFFKNCIDAGADMVAIFLRAEAIAGHESGTDHAKWLFSREIVLTGGLQIRLGVNFARRILLVRDF